MNILIIAFNLYKGGSLQIRNFILDSLNNMDNNENCYILLLSSDVLVPQKILHSNNIKIIRIKYPIAFKPLNIIYRLYFEQIFPIFLKAIYNINKVILFNNVPILFFQSNIQKVYFHNVNYLRNFSFQKLYFNIVLKIKYGCTYFVQSSVVKNELSKYFRGKIFIVKHPFSLYYNNLLMSCEINTKTINLLKKISSNSFLYPAYYYPHKNHKMLRDMEHIFEKNNLIIYVTIEDYEFNEMFYDSKSIVNLGKLENIEILLLMNKIKGLVNVSLNESLMIPIIEAMILKRKILSIKRDYSEFLLGKSGFYFEDSVSLNNILASDEFNQNIEYNMSHIDCDYNQFINQFLIT